MIRTPEIRYTGATTAEVLAQKPTGFNFDLCPGALALCGRTAPGAVDDVLWEGADGPFPPPRRVLRRLLRARPARRT